MKFKALIICVLAFTRVLALDICFTNALVQGPNSTIVPFTYYQSLILLHASVEGQEGNFILDTGANGLVLNDKYYDADRIAEASAYGISGNIMSIGESRVDSLSLNTLMFYDIRAEHIDLEEIEDRKKVKILGLIGYDVIKNYEIMLNYREKYVTFSNLDAAGEIIEVLHHTREKVDSFEFDFGRFIPIINVSVNGKSKRMGIDTGAEVNVIDNRRNRDVLENFKVVNRINISGADGRKKQALAGILFRVRLGENYRCASMATMMTNMNNLNEIYGTKLDGILGHSFLAPWIFSINYKKQLLYIHKIKFAKT